MKRVIKTYLGGKGASGTYQKIINHIRPHDCYIEAFLGGGTIMLAKQPAAVNIGVEIDPKVYQVWKKKARNLSHIQLHNSSAFEFLASFEYSVYDRVCVYLDPPYPMSTRKDPNTLYDFELSNQQHLQLLELIKNLPENVDVLISSYPNGMYAKALADWHCLEFRSQTRRGPVWEVLYMNYATVDDLHDPQYVGQNYRERERIKKKVNRWRTKFKQMSPAERAAIFQALAQLIEPATVEPVVLEPEPVTLASPTKAGDILANSDISPNQMTLFQ